MPVQHQEVPDARTYVLAMNGHRVVVEAEKLVINEMPVTLTRTQQDILYAIAAQEGATIDDHDLIGCAEGHRSTVSVHLCRIRAVFKSVTASEDLFHLIESVGNHKHRVPAEHYESPKIVQPTRHTFKVGTATVIMRENGTVTVNDALVHLTGKEQQVFRFLAERVGKVCTKIAMLTGLYGDDYEMWPEYKILDVFVCKLRKKLAAVDENALRLITTTWGRGYVLDPNPPKRVFEGSLTPDINSRDLGIKDLPPTNCRWVVKRKAVVVKLLAEGKVEMPDLCERYPDLTEAEVTSWRGQINRGGISALRVTRIAA